MIDAVLATEETFEDNPVAGLYFGIFGLLIAGTMVRSGWKWRGSSASERNRNRTSRFHYVPYVPVLDLVVGIVLAVFCFMVGAWSCVVLITR